MSVRPTSDVRQYPMSRATMNSAVYAQHGHRNSPKVKPDLEGMTTMTPTTATMKCFNGRVE
jgi:hypothetical protein